MHWTKKKTKKVTELIKRLGYAESEEDAKNNAKKRQANTSEHVSRYQKQQEVASTKIAEIQQTNQQLVNANTLKESRIQALCEEIRR